MKAWSNFLHKHGVLKGKRISFPALRGFVDGLPTPRAAGGGGDSVM